VSRDDLVDVANRGTITPDHVIRVKPRPLILPPQASDATIAAALRDYSKEYVAYFDRNVRRATEPKTRLDALPRVMIVRDVGLFGVGRTAGDAKIAADLATQAARVIPAAEQIGRYQPIAEPDVFDMEYWSLEQAKLNVRARAQAS
jgi:rhamnose utilization protein RhaD (predicted bifunctional aldolase and dehydrogenase)